MNIEELVEKQLLKRFFTHNDIATAIRNALTEQAETHALELRAYETTVQNLEQRIKDLQLEMLANGEAQRVQEGYVIVPVIATDRMVAVGMTQEHDLDPCDIAILWTAMAAAAPAPAPVILASRCPMCFYQHGHQIGCENNPVDIALLAAAPKKEGSK